VTRRRSSAPGRDRPDRRRSFLVLAALLALVLSACGGSSASPSGTASAGPEASTEALASPTADPSDAATDEPTETPEDSAEPTDDPSDEPTDEPSSEPSPSDGGAAGGCTGTPENQEFYASVAAAVDWPVYCPALPKGWFVQSGSYRLAGGARLEISYRGPGGAHIDLKEGAFCSSSDGCVPDGTDAGTAAFGDRQGELVSVGSDSWAISDDAGANPSWLLTGTGLAEEAFRKIAADLVVVGA
jgi:hypothetical protein